MGAGIEPTMYAEEDFLQLSALQHFVFCQRQCALLHIEQIWSENIFTAEGRIMHDKVHEEQFESRPGIRIERAMPLRSVSLGINGKADVIEFHKQRDGSWFPFPVEYKRGKPKQDNCDKVQLCAQAICLEEMMKTRVPSGSIYYGKTKHRFDVEFSEELRRETLETVEKVHEFLKKGITPKPEYSKQCESCSVISSCLPKAMYHHQTVRDYIQSMSEQL